MKQTDNQLIWIDLETTGLNGKQKNGELGAQYHEILEIAGIITDDQLNPIGSPFRVAIFHEDEALEKLDPKAREMHEKSGLLKEVRESGVTLEDAEKQFLCWLKKNGIKKYNRKARSGGVMAGSSIQFDRSFIMCQMPELNDYLHYRMLDVSSFDLASQYWNPEIREELVKERKHEALADIKESIAEAILYKAALMRKDRAAYRAGYEAGVKSGELDGMDSDWVVYRNA